VRRDVASRGQGCGGGEGRGRRRRAAGVVAVVAGATRPWMHGNGGVALRGVFVCVLRGVAVGGGHDRGLRAWRCCVAGV